MRVNVKLQNIDLGLYIPRFGEVGHPPKHLFLTTFFGVGRDPVPRGLREATFLDFCDFGIHFGGPFSSLFSIIFQASKRGPGFFPTWNLVNHTFGLGGNRGEHPTYGNHPSLCKAMGTASQSKSNRRTGGRTGELEFEPADSDTFREGQVRTAGSNRLSQPAEPLNR